METVFKEFRDKSVIIIAHRLECIKNVDNIIVVKQGHVVGEGQFEELISHCDSFKDLWVQRWLKPVKLNDYMIRSKINCSQ